MTTLKELGEMRLKVISTRKSTEDGSTMITLEGGWEVLLMDRRPSYSGPVRIVFPPHARIS